MSCAIRKIKAGERAGGSTMGFANTTIIYKCSFFYAEMIKQFYTKIK